jgi:hypothetical protein
VGLGQRHLRFVQVLTMTTTTTTTDPHNLITSGEPLATAPELSKLLGCSVTAMRDLLGGAIYHEVRFCKPGGPWLYSVADATKAFEPHRAEVTERARKAAERQAAEQSARAARVAANDEAWRAKQARRKAAKQSPAPTPAPAPIPSRAAPEVFVRRRA